MPSEDRFVTGPVTICTPAAASVISVVTWARFRTPWRRRSAAVRMKRATGSMMEPFGSPRPAAVRLIHQGCQAVPRGAGGKIQVDVVQKAGGNGGDLLIVVESVEDRVHQMRGRRGCFPCRSRSGLKLTGRAASRLSGGITQFSTKAVFPSAVNTAEACGASTGGPLGPSGKGGPKNGKWQRFQIEPGGIVGCEAGE